MKKILPFLILLNIGLTYAQQYEPIVDVSKKWNILLTSINFDGPDDYLSTSISKIGSEIVINGITYNSIIGVGELSDKYIREDNNGNVFIYPGINGVESILYNFELEIGDTIDLPNFYDGSLNTWTVINVETITINNTFKKKITLDFIGNQEIWIEGIGSSKGLPFSGYMPIDFDWSLLCYYNNNELILQNGSSCNVSTNPTFDVSFFTTYTFDFSHFLIDGTTIEAPAGETDAYFVCNTTAQNNEIETFISGLCHNGTSSLNLINNNQSITILERGGTTLADCNNHLGNIQEGRYFDILTGNYYLQSNNPLPVYYEKSTDGLTLTMWNFENEKLVFDVNERLSISDFNFKENFDFYPNPATSIFTISSTLTNYNIEIYTLLGKKIIEKQNESLITQLDISNLTKGIYFVKISTNQNNFSIKMVKN